MILLIVLIGITIPLFIFTRSIAAKNRSMNVQVARAWYDMAQQQLKTGNTKQAIEMLRKAATNDHDNPQYALSLAAALATDGHIEEARQGLLRLRMSEPENGEINLSLARLDAKEGSMPEAVRYYHNALYGAWPPDRMSTQRTSVRTELVRFLLSSGDTSRALSELLILASDVPDHEDAHIDVGRLFLEAGDSRHALGQFQRALQLNSTSEEALRGAGKAAFDLTDYSTARRFLESAVAIGDHSQDTADRLETSKLVLSRDPLASRLATYERIRRLVQNLDFASTQLDNCINEKMADQSALSVLEPLRLELTRSSQEDLAAANLKADPEGFRTGMNLIYRIETAASQICNASSNLDSALLLIAKTHGVTEQ